MQKCVPQYRVPDQLQPQHAIRRKACANSSGREMRALRRAAEQRDAANEGRLDPYRSTSVGEVIVNEGKVVRPSQLIASVRRTTGG